jgi:hypothetical protein
MWTMDMIKSSGNFKTISGLIELDDNGGQHDTTLNVYGDNKLLDTYSLKAGSLSQNFNVNVTGVSQLDFKFVNDSGFDEDFVDIVNPVLQ